MTTRPCCNVRQRVVAMLAVAFLSQIGLGAPVVYDFAGRITSVVDPRRVLPSSDVSAIGTRFSGQFSYDSIAPRTRLDGALGPEGLYFADSFSVSIGARTDLSTDEVRLHVVDRAAISPGYSPDYVNVTASPFPSFGGLPELGAIQAVAINLFDAEGRAFSGLDIPPLLRLSRFESARLLVYSHDGDPDGDGRIALNYQIAGSIDSLSRATFPPPAGRPIEITPLPERGSASGLILIAHGYNSSPEAWARDLKDKISARLESEGLDGQWDIVAYDWSDGADVILPSSSVSAAEQIGRALGKQINTLGYSKVHFIGHSAGAWLVDSAANEIDGDATLSTTFLDAYVFNERSASKLGKASDWAEQYYNSADLPGAGINLANAFNVDITRLDPDFLAQLGHPEVGFNNIDAHQFPHEWYRRSVSTDSLDSRGWGFALSSELNNLPTHDRYRRGSGLDLAPIGPELVSSPPPSFVFGPIIDFEEQAIVTSETGLVTANSTVLSLETGSPAWAQIHVDVATPISLIKFTLEIDDDSGGEGVLAIYWDDFLLAQLDERYVDTALTEYVFEIGDLGTIGDHMLSFRLDSFSTQISRATIGGLHLGRTTVPAPSNALLWLGLFIVLVLQRHTVRELC